MFWIFNPLIARDQRKCLMDLSCRLTRRFDLSEWDVMHFMKILNSLFCASVLFLTLHGKYGTVMGHFPSNSLPQPASHIDRKIFSPLLFSGWA